MKSRRRSEGLHPLRLFTLWSTALVSLAFLSPAAIGQQTLGSLNGAVTDVSGAVVQKATIKIRDLATNLEVRADSKSDGSFSAADLPIGTYEVTFTRDGFKTAVYNQILVQGNRTTTVNARFQPGAVATTVTVEATPLLKVTDMTTGYTLADKQTAEIPLGTGSFTQAAILSPGVSADFLNTAGTNAGLGNQSIWANGRRNTSNSFTINGVSGNIFSPPSFDIPSSDVSFNPGFCNPPSSSFSCSPFGYSFPLFGSLGQLPHTIGSPRLVQMALHLEI